MGHLGSQERLFANSQRSQRWGKFYVHDGVLSTTSLPSLSPSLTASGTVYDNRAGHPLQCRHGPCNTLMECGVPGGDRLHQGKHVGLTLPNTGTGLEDMLCVLIIKCSDYRHYFGPISSVLITIAPLTHFSFCNADGPYYSIP